MPDGWRSTREMRQTCAIASANRTKFIGMLISLYSASDSFIIVLTLSTARHGSNAGGVISRGAGERGHRVVACGGASVALPHGSR